MKATYRIGGMHCDGCVRSVTNALKRADPGAQVTVDLGGGRVSIEGALAEDAVKRVVEQAGYSFDGKAD